MISMMRKILTKLQSFLGLIILLICLGIILITYAKYNIVTCEEIIISEVLMEELREEIYKSLVAITKDPLFRKQYSDGSMLFYFTYILNTYSVKEFVESLPLKQIIEQHISEGFPAIAQIIIEQFIEDLEQKQSRFRNKTLYLFVSSTIIGVHKLVVFCCLRDQMWILLFDKFIPAFFQCYFNSHMSSAAFIKYVLEQLWEDE